MDKARAGGSPPKVAYMAYMRHFCFEFNKKSSIYTEIFMITFFYIAYAVILLPFHVKKAYTPYKPILRRGLKPASPARNSLESLGY